MKTMNDEDIKYFRTTKTTMRRAKTMLHNLSERVEISDASSKFAYAEDKIDNALHMLDLVEFYADKSNANQLEMTFES